MTRWIAIALGLIALAIAGCAPGTTAGTTAGTTTRSPHPAGPQYNSGDRMGGGGAGGGM